MSRRIIDLTLTVQHGMRGVEIVTNSTTADRGYNTTNLHLYSHSGTHMDAPLHFIDNARTIDQVLLEKCIGPALVVDLTHKEPNSLITLADLGDSAQRIGPGSRLLLHTGWSAHAQLPDYRTHFPRISLELANWLAQKQIWLIGMEMPSVAALGDYTELSSVHRALLAAEIVIVESLTNLDQLNQKEVFFIATPLKIQNGDGSPVRAVALEENEDG